MARVFRNIFLENQVLINIFAITAQGYLFMEHFLATHFVTMNFFAYSRKRYFNEIYYEVELNREVEDFVRNLTIELKGKKFWKRYARKGSQRLIRGLWHIQFGSTRDLPHAHIQLEKPAWCDECRFINAIHMVARRSRFSRNDASAVDVRRCDYSQSVNLKDEYVTREDRRSYW